MWLDECGCGSLFVLLLSCGDSSSSEREGEGHWVMPSEAVSSLEVDGRVILTLGIMRSDRTLWPWTDVGRGR